jgi:predicted RNA binding protein YcfA (HicA-like mRNA interferase family)
MNGKQVITKLNQHGWQVLRIRGSHHQLGKADLRTTVPVHGKQDLGIGIIKKIERDTGVKLR